VQIKYSATMKAKAKIAGVNINLGTFSKSLVVPNIIDMDVLVVRGALTHVHPFGSACTV
jgi:hypothetical protein